MSPLKIQHKTPLSGYWFIIGAALLWGTTGTAQAFSPPGYDPMVIGALRLLIGGISLLLLAIKSGETGNVRDWFTLPIFMAALFTASYQLCFFAAVAKTGVAIGTIVGIGSAPIAGGLLGFIFRGEKPGRRWLLATLLAIIGCTLLSLSGGDIAIDPLGIVLALGAGSSYAAYTLVIKGLIDKQPSNAILAAVFCIGAVLLLPVFFTADFNWLLQPRAIGVALHLGIVTTALSYWLFTRGLKTIQVGTAVTLSLAEPMTAATLGILVLGEQLNPQAFFGISFIFTGLVILFTKGRTPTGATT